MMVKRLYLQSKDTWIRVMNTARAQDFRSRHSIAVTGRPSGDIAAATTVSAALRVSVVSSASHTSPTPPSPSGEMIVS